LPLNANIDLYTCLCILCLLHKYKCTIYIVLRIIISWLLWGTPEFLAFWKAEVRESQVGGERRIVSRENLKNKAKCEHRAIKVFSFEESLQSVILHEFTLQLR
jgi:hypothetical protein